MFAYFRHYALFTPLFFFLFSRCRALFYDDAAVAHIFMIRLHYFAAEMLPYYADARVTDADAMMPRCAARYLPPLPPLSSSASIGGMPT